MKFKMILIALVGFAFLVFLIIFLITNKDTAPIQINENVSVSYKKQVPLDAELARSQPTKIPSNRFEDISQPSLSPINSASSGEIHPNMQFQLHFVDMLGEPIPAGSIKGLGKTYPFQNGFLCINDIQPDLYRLEISAPGYQTKIESIDFRNLNRIDICLEYQCDFDVVVFSDASQTVRAASATVNLFKITEADRPIWKQKKVNLEGELYNEPYNFEFRDGELRILKLLEIRDFDDANFKPILGKQRYTPNTNDRVIAIGQCTWNPNELGIESTQDIHAINLFPFIPKRHTISRKLRIMDSLSFTQPRYVGAVFKEICTFDRKDSTGFSYLVFPPKLSLSNPICQAMTDSNGICRFTALSPGLYYVQAEKGQLKSHIKPLHPASGGVKLELSSLSCLKVYTWLGNIPDEYHFWNKKLEGVKIIIKSKNQNFIYMAENKTNLGGWALFEKVPFGDYTISAYPPESSALQPLFKDVSITQPDESLLFEFDNWNKHKIEGTVLRTDTKTGVEDYPVCLKELQSPTGGDGNRVTTVTDKNGHYEFDNLPQGLYLISHVVSDLKNVQYYPTVITSSTSENNLEYYPYENFVIESSWKNNLHSAKSEVISIENDPIYQCNLWVSPIIKSRFSGRVINNQSKPVEGALVYVSPIRSDLPKMLSFEDRPITDTKGFFSFVVMSKGGFTGETPFFKGRVNAVLAKICPPYWIEDKGMDGKVYGHSVAKEEITITSTGFQKVDFHLGDSINNLLITVDDTNTTTLEGQFVGNDGKIPDNVDLKITQSGMTNSIKVDRNGFFKTSIVNDGRYIYLEYSNAYRYDNQSEYGFVTYLSDSINIPFQKNKKYIEIKIALPIS